jgi:hypothetical protein
MLFIYFYVSQWKNIRIQKQSPFTTKKKHVFILTKKHVLNVKIRIIINSSELETTQMSITVK